MATEWNLLQYCPKSYDFLSNSWGSWKNRQSRLTRSLDGNVPPMLSNQRRAFLHPKTCHKVHLHKWLQPFVSGPNLVENGVCAPIEGGQLGLPIVQPCRKGSKNNTFFTVLSLTVPLRHVEWNDRDVVPEGDN